MPGKVTEIKTILRDTLDLRRMLLTSLDDLLNQRITPNDARARSWLARAALDTLRIEMIAAREGLKDYAPVRLLPEGDPLTIEGDLKK